MPYQITFTKKAEVSDEDQYFNDCCYGGDIIVEQLLPMVRKYYVDVQTNQEDWGWFIWFKEKSLSLAIDIYCDDKDRGEFRMHLTARGTKWLFFDSIADGPEIEKLKSMVVPMIEKWLDQKCQVIQLDKKHFPIK